MLGTSISMVFDVITANCKAVAPLKDVRTKNPQGTNEI